jgi:hypothetical protein
MLDIGQSTTCHNLWVPQLLGLCNPITRGRSGICQSAAKHWRLLLVLLESWCWHWWHILLSSAGSSFSAIAWCLPYHYISAIDNEPYMYLQAFLAKLSMFLTLMLQPSHTDKSLSEGWMTTSPTMCQEKTVHDTCSKMWDADCTSNTTESTY